MPHRMLHRMLKYGESLLDVRGGERGFRGKRMALRKADYKAIPPDIFHAETRVDHRQRYDRCVNVVLLELV